MDFVYLPFLINPDEKQFINGKEVNIFNSAMLKHKEFLSNIKDYTNPIEDDEEILTSPVNSKYYDIKSLNSLKIDVPSSFGVFHVNIASLDKHIDDLNQVLSHLKYNYDVIGISEHKIKKDCQPSNNINITGYEPFIFEPTETTHGGTGFYIKQNTDYIERPDLKFNSPSNYASMFIEIKFPKKKDILLSISRLPILPMIILNPF